MEMRPGGREALMPALWWIIRRIFRNASMMGLLYRPKWFGTPLRLESVKKTHQVARVGMGPHPSRLLPAWAAISAERGGSRAFGRGAVCPTSTATRHQPGICLATLGY